VVALRLRVNKAGGQFIQQPPTQPSIPLPPSNPFENPNKTQQKDDVTSVAARGHELLCGSVDGSVTRFDVRIGRAYRDDLHAPVSAALFTGDGLCVLAACLDSALRLLDKETGAFLSVCFVFVC
jgi:WD40 repeat protein